MGGPDRQILAEWIGGRVWEALASGPLHAGGQTSRGGFLTAGERWIVFLTTDRARGPLTINLGAAEEDWPDGCHDQGWQADLGRHVLVAPGVSVALPAGRTWRTPPAPRGGDSVQALSRARSLWHVLRTRRGVDASTEMLRVLLDTGGAAPGAEMPTPYQTRVLQLLGVMRAGDGDGVARALDDALGLGQGLTPSGDDLVIGILVAAHRWTPEPLGSLLRAAGDAVAAAARTRTTRLSASLIACAAGGEADERLLDVADYLWAGAASEARAVEAVLDWGASSGVDALTGMTLLLLAGTAA